MFKKLLARATVFSTSSKNSYAFPDGNVFYRKLTESLPKIVRGKGTYLYDSRGKRYFDASGGAVVVNIGHGLVEISDAISDQAQKIAYVNGTQFTNEPVEALASEIVNIMPGSLNKVYFLCSGSEATEASIKLSRQFWVASGYKSKFKIIGLTPGYHGNTLAALSISGRPHIKNIFSPLLQNFPLIPAPTCYRCPYGKSYPECGVKCAFELEAVLQREGSETVSAFIAEPIISVSAGVTKPPGEYFKIVRDICARHNVLFIADEILTGMGRAGTWLCIEKFNVIPDIILLGKGLSGGYAPLSAVVVKEKIVKKLADSAGYFMHGQTYSHTPIICAAGLAAIRYLKQHRLIERSAEMGSYLLEQLQRLRDFPFVGDIRGEGLLVGIEFVKDRATKQPFPREFRFTEKIKSAALKNGLVLWQNVGHVDGKNGDLIILGPPFIINRQQVDELVDLLETTLTTISDSLAFAVDN